VSEGRSAIVGMTGSEPDFAIGGLSLWIHGWEREDSSNSWDANWLRITARQKSVGSTVTISGAIIQAMDISRFLLEIEELYKNLTGEASLHSYEPNLKVVLEAKGLGHIEMIVHITPDHMSQQHRFQSEIDQSYLPNATAALKAILAVYAPRALT
jgi:hypothetical protein